MKNLPDKFPIRYALIVSIYNNGNEEERISQLETLFNEYLLLIKNKPLDFSLLFPEYMSLDFTILGKKAFQISKLYPEEGWIDVVKKKIKEIMPNFLCSSWSIGSPFSVGLYGYKKACEIPAFVNLKGLGSNYYKKMYERIRKGEVSDWEIYEMLSEHNKSLKQDLYYSEIWEELDENIQMGGHIMCTHMLRDGEWFEGLPKKKYKTKIPVLICKSWEDLFAEELFILYKMFRYCNNCGKALPLGYNGKYCPNNPENIDCIRERARKRKHSQNKD